MRRSTITSVVALLVVALPLVAATQPSTKTARIGFLSPGWIEGRAGAGRLID